MIKRFIIFLAITCVAQLVSCQDLAEQLEGEIQIAVNDVLTLLDNVPETTPEAVVTPKRVRKRKTTTAPLTCLEKTKEDRDNCFNDIGVIRETCAFSIINEDCDWKCECDTTDAPPIDEPTEEVSLTESEEDSPESEEDSPESEEDSPESPEDSSLVEDKEIKFENCWIKVSGFVRHTRN